MKRMPDFIIIGAAKCGTTALFDQLGQHPDIRLSCCKETRFFTADRYDSAAIDRYASVFKQERAVIGEASPQYTFRPRDEVAPRIHHHCPDARLIYIVRDPIERIRSAWVETRSGGQGAAIPIEQWLSESDMAIQISRYMYQLTPYLELFGSDRVLILFAEDFRSDEAATLRECFSFLGVDPNKPLLRREIRPNTSGSKQIDSALLTNIRALPAFSALRDRSPEWLRSSLRGLLKHQAERPEVGPETRSRIIETLGDDPHEFLRFAGKHADFWNL